MSKKHPATLTAQLQLESRSTFPLFLQWPRHHPSGRMLVTILSVLLTVAVLLLARFHTLWPSLSVVRREVPATFNLCAPLGGHKTAFLPDGTTAELNTGTCVTGVFSRKLRLLRLESGEGIFQVMHDPGRPFVVETGRVSIADIGTRFDVYTRDPGGTRVAVMQGAVQIYPRGMTSRQNGTPLAAGQQIDIPTDAATVSLLRRITPEEIGRMTAWLDGTIQLDGQPLSAILAEFERYQHISFKVTDPKITRLPIGGTFRTTDVDSFLRALRLQCIRGSYDETHQNITLTRVAGCP